MSFDIAFQRTVGIEGGYVNNPSDPGGPTKYGITQVVARENGYTGDMSDFPLDAAKAIYLAKYWNFIAADTYAAAIGFQVFDAAVNHGNVQAARLLQQAVGVPADGYIGPESRKAVAALPVACVVLNFIAARLRFYGGLPTFAEFGKGWTTNRMPQNLNYAAQDLLTAP